MQFDPDEGKLRVQDGEAVEETSARLRVSVKPSHRFYCEGIVSEKKEPEQKAIGSWPEDSLQRAFVEGAKWWEFTKTGATMWQEDQGKAEQAAIDKYGFVQTVDGFEMWMFNLKYLEDCMLLMGGEWVEGWKEPEDGLFQTYSRTTDWDRDNQPIRWKPLL